MDLEDIETVRERLQFRGAQGTTGSQATFLELFNGDADKIKELNKILCKKAGFPSAYAISTQTYTRKVDLRVANAVCALGATAERICGDIRHLANLKEMEEPFEKSQIGSSAMAYKRNPMRSERITALGRKLARLPADFTATFEAQWFERTLDDSAIRRMDIPEMFLLADSILLALDNVTNGLVVYPNVVRARIDQELPFMATESILMKLAGHGVSRQDAHEEIRVLSHEASAVVKQQGGRNDLLERIKKNEFFKVSDDAWLDTLYISLANSTTWYSPSGETSTASSTPLCLLATAPRSPRTTATVRWLRSWPSTRTPLTRPRLPSCRSKRPRKKKEWRLDEQKIIIRHFMK